jgi:hypothetical protein
MLEAIQKNVSWRVIPVAGIAGGVAYLVVAFLLMPVTLDINPTLLLQYIAALVLGADALLENQVSVWAVGLVVHMVLSVGFALVIAIVVHRWGLVVGIIGGAILGVAIYLINLYTLTLVFEWFFAINNSVLLLAHVAFGAVTGGVYEVFDHYDEGLGTDHAS